MILFGLFPALATMAVAKPRFISWLASFLQVCIQSGLSTGKKPLLSMSGDKGQKANFMPASHPLAILAGQGFEKPAWLGYVFFGQRLGQ